MWSFIENKVQEGLLNFELAVVFDQAQPPKFVHEKIHARSCRANHLSECLLVELYGQRFQATVIAVIGQQQKSPCQPHLAGIEQLVDQVRFNPGGPSQKMGEKIVGKLLFLMEEADYGRLL